MMISVRRTNTGAGLTLRAKGADSGSGDYDQTIHPGESALGFTYEEWDTAVGAQRERRIELTEDGTLHPIAEGRAGGGEDSLKGD